MPLLLILGDKNPELIKAWTIAFAGIPGLCTGYGKMPFDRCALQMRAAYDIVFGPASNEYRTLENAIVEEKRYTGKT